MNTDLSIYEIECAIIKHDLFNIRKNIVVCNVSWGLLPHEADMVIMSKSGYLTEIEIKRSLSDLKADFKKKHDHSCELIKYFYYAVPECFVEDCRNLIALHKRKVSGIIGYSENGDICFFNSYHDFPNAKHFCLGGRKLFIEEQFQLARLGAMRVWGLKKKLIGKEHFK